MPTATAAQVHAAREAARRPGPRDRPLALQPRHRHAVLAREGQVVQVRPAQGRARLRRPEDVRPLRGRMAARRPGAPLGAARRCRTSRSTSSRPAAPPASPRAASSSTTSASTTRCSATRCRTSTSPRESNWLMLGPSGPRRLRLAVEHLCQYRGGICFCVDLDPRWVVKLIKKGWMEHLKAYQEHLHRPGDDDPVGRPRHQVHVHDAEAARRPVQAAGEGGHRASRKAGITGIFCGGTEMTSQWIRFTIEEYLGAGRLHHADLRQHADGPGGGRHADGGRQLQDHLLRPAAAGRRAGGRLRRLRQGRRVRPDRPGAADDADEGVLHAALPERDEGEREPPSAKYPWDGVSGVRPFHEFAATTTVGVY